MAQWHWLEETGHPDQFNSLHERLIARWEQIFNTLPPGGNGDTRRIALAG